MVISLDVTGGKMCCLQHIQYCVQSKGIGGRGKGHQGWEYNSYVERLDEDILTSLKIYLGTKKGHRE